MEDGLEFLRLAVPDAEPIDARILDAAAELIGRDGERDTTMTAIAERAGVGRATIFRRFGSKQEILDRALMRELRGFVEDLLAAASDADTAAAALTELFVQSVRFSRGNPIVRRLATFEPERLIDFARLKEPNTLELARTLVTGIVNSFNAPASSSVDCIHLADMLCHLAIAYAVAPDSSLDLEDEAGLRRIVGSVIAPVLGRR